MRILVTGSRDWVEWNVINDALNEYAGCSDITIVHGACPTGADAMADRWVAYQGVHVERHSADWSQGRKAGPARNQAMVALGADLCLAFPLPSSRGTRNCMRLAREAGIPVREFKPNA